MYTEQQRLDNQKAIISKVLYNHAYSGSCNQVDGTPMLILTEMERILPKLVAHFVRYPDSKYNAAQRAICKGGV